MTMKNPSVKFSILAIFLILGLSACSYWQGDLAKIVISFGGSGRAGYDAGNSEDHQRLNHEVILTSSTEELNFNKSGITFEAYVMPGSWNILIYSYLDGKIYATGSKEDVVLKLGQDNIVLIDMYQAHLVEFDSQGGGDVPAQKVRDGGQAQKPSDPTRKGYSFGGWYSDKDLTKSFDFSTQITGSIILYAKWNIISEVPGNNLAEKLKWLYENAVDGGEYVITVKGNENLAPQDLSFDGKTISITLKGDAQIRTVSLSSNGSLFTIDSGVTLILDRNITLQGRTSNTTSMVKINNRGKLEMNADSKITRNYNTTTTGDFQAAGVHIYQGGTFTMNDGEISGNTTAKGGGGVWVDGTFTMIKGKISGNKAIENSGGGVWITSTGNFTMSGGEISGNEALGLEGGEGGGVHMYNDGGTFTMNGGTISGNKARSSGGVCVHEGGGFTMSGTAIISGNTATEWGGGGVNVYQNATFTMEGGKISGNNGGGVSVSGEFIMNDGQIFGNTVVDGGGGGVSVGEGGTFTMKGGEIHDNTAWNGGGVNVWRGIFTMDKVVNSTDGGKIYNNHANRWGGGGVDVGEGGTFTMKYGKIYKNDAIDGGGGVDVYSSGKFTMQGGEIYDNEISGGYGGGVRVQAELDEYLTKVIARGTFIMSGGEIYRNKAQYYGGGVYVFEGTFKKSSTGGIIYGYSSDPKSNQAIEGHAVYATNFYNYYEDNVTKYKNSTVTSTMTLDYIGNGANSTFTGDWDKESNSFIEIEIVDMDEWELLVQNVRVNVNNPNIFQVSGDYIEYTWYLNGISVPNNNSSAYTFFQSSPGIYEVSVVVKDKDGVKRSGSCQVIVK